VARRDGALIADLTVRAVDAEFAASIVGQDLFSASDCFGLRRKYGADATGPGPRHRPSVVTLHYVAGVRLRH